jgi:hypothetical protein
MKTNSFNEINALARMNSKILNQANRAFNISL